MTKNPNPATNRLHDAHPGKDQIYKIAWRIAAKLVDGKRPSELEWQALDHAVRRHPKYKKTAGKMAGFDGI